MGLAPCGHGQHTRTRRRPRRHPARLQQPALGSGIASPAHASRRWPKLRRARGTDSTGRTPPLNSSARSPRREGTTLPILQALRTVLTQPSCALGVFVPVGLHPAAAERHHLDQLAQAGADLFEVGLAAEDAALDGPVIQAAYRRALSRGNVLDRTLRAIQHAAGLRPTVLMTYWDPIRRDPEHLARLFADAGATGVMVVDLPTRQQARWHDAAQEAGLRTPLLIPRTTAAAGLPATVAHASGWLYAPASTAATGYQGPLDIPALDAFIRRLRAASMLPVVSGVGISTPALAARVAALVNAVVIGTPVVGPLAADPDRAAEVTAAFAQALHAGDSAEHDA